MTQHDCDAELRADPRYDPFRCRPDWFKCSCGRRWVHICDEAEGCFYMSAEAYAEAIVAAKEGKA